jgi:hypothetical protein
MNASAVRVTGLMRYPAAIMKLLSIVQCARPVLFENASCDHPYLLGGTAFIVKFKERSFVITAGHVLSLKSFEPRTINPLYTGVFRSIQRLIGW